MASNLDAGHGLIRLRIPLERTDDEPGPLEDMVWAEPLGSGRYRLESCPFFAGGLSRNDVIQADVPPGQGPPVLAEVVEKGGHRTLRLSLAAAVELASPQVQQILERLSELGCGHELLRPRLAAVDLPPEAELPAVAELLQRAAQDGVLRWEWADPRPC